jgi:replication fork protection complex subunit Csm3/Swi3
MQVALSVWRDEAHGLVNGKVPESAEDTVDLTSDVENPGPNASANNNRAPSSPPPEFSRPPSSTGDIEEDFDIDAFLAHEEEQAASATVDQTSAPPVKHTYGQGTTESGTSIDDQMDWDAVDALDDVVPPVAAENLFDNDAPMNDVNDKENISPPLIVDEPPAIIASHEDDWDEMYL